MRPAPGPGLERSRGVDAAHQPGRELRARVGVELGVSQRCDALPRLLDTTWTCVRERPLADGDRNDRLRALPRRGRLRR